MTYIGNQYSCYTNTINTVTAQRNQNILPITLLVLSLALAACSDSGGNSPQDLPEDENSSNQSIHLALENGSAFNASFNPHEGADTSNITLPIAGTVSVKQKTLAAASSMDYSFHQQWEYQSLMPHPELVCAQPDAQGFQSVAEQLGGFKKGSFISIEQDASAPHILTGILLHFGITGMSSANSIEDKSSATTIQRPDIVGREGNKIFYLSDIYGLILVKVNDDATEVIDVSCALPLPGKPKSFLISGDRLLVLSQSMDHRHSAVLQFNIGGAGLNFSDSLYFENQTLIDARLFNDTLVFFAQETELVEQASGLGSGGSSIAKTVADATVYPTSQKMASSISSSLDIPYISRKIVSHQLKVIATRPRLSLSHNEVFIEDEEPDINSPIEPEADRWYSRFNSFLSASGEHLVVT